MDTLKRLLLVVDPQVDFVSGTLPVPGAEGAMNGLADYIAGHGGEYESIVVTADRHPMDHSSFVTEGGRWPVHCVADSVGAAIWPSVMDGLMKWRERVVVLHKGEDAGREEYSIFKNVRAAGVIRDIVAAKGVVAMDVCGLAGDVCVADTIRDAVAQPWHVSIRVLRRFAPSIDGGATLDGVVAGCGCDET